VGALVPGTGDRTRLFARLIPRFSRVAIISVVLLSITGVVQAVIQLGSFAALMTSNYGRVLDLKIFLFVLLLCLGAYNLRKVSPRMKAFAASTDANEGAGSLAAGTLQRAFRRAIRGEVGLMVLLLLVVGGLTSLSPPPPPRHAATPTGGAYIHQGQMEDLNYRLVINPGKIGENTIEVALTDTHGKPVQGADAVIVRFMMLDMAMGIQEEDLQPITHQPGHYTATSSDLSMGGHWRMTLIVRRAGFNDAQTSISSTFQ
jgi:copper transport protein